MKLFSKKNFRAGFTLIELLIVIAILGILAAGIVVVINPMEKINSANLAKAKTFAAGVENSLVMSQVGKWSFDDEEDPGKDTSGNGNDGAINGEAAWQTPAQCGLDLGGCMKFDGVDDYVDVGSGTSLNITGPISVEAWVYLNSFCGSGYHPVQSGNSYGMEVIGGTHEMAFWVNDIGGWDNSKTANAVPLHTWKHYVGVYNGSQIKIYEDGTQSGTPTNSGNPVSLSQSIKIGWNSAGIDCDRYWPGLIDEVKIYNKALLSYQIQQLYARGLVKHQLALK